MGVPDSSFPGSKKPACRPSQFHVSEYLYIPAGRILNSPALLCFHNTDYVFLIPLHRFCKNFKFFFHHRG